MDFLELFQHKTDLVWLKAGEVLFADGDLARDMYVVMHGTLDVQIGGRHVESAGAGAVIGEMALLGRTERSATVTARSPCRLVALDVQQFDALIRQHPRFAREVMQIMAERLRRLSEQLLEDQPRPRVMEPSD